jgi:hypothetical protein
MGPRPIFYSIFQAPRTLFSSKSYRLKTLISSPSQHLDFFSSSTFSLFLTHPHPLSPPHHSIGLTSLPNPTLYSLTLYPPCPPPSPPFYFILELFIYFRLSNSHTSQPPHNPHSCKSESSLPSFLPPPHLCLLHFSPSLTTLSPSLIHLPTPKLYT